MLHLFLNNTHVAQSGKGILNNKLIPVYKALKPGPNPTITGKVKVTRPWNKSLSSHRLDIVIVGEIVKIQRIHGNSSSEEIKAENRALEEFSRDTEAFEVNLNRLTVKEYNFSITLSKDNETTSTDMFQLRYYIKAELLEIKTEKVIFSVKQDIIVERFCREIQRPRIYEVDIGVAQRLILKINLNKTNFFPDEVVVGKLTFLMNKFIFERIEIYLKKIEVTGGENIHEERVYLQEVRLDRNPEEGERIAFKIDLKKFNLVPNLMVQSLKGIKYSLVYQLFVALYDERDTRLFKKFPIQIRQRETTM